MDLFILGAGMGIVGGMLPSPLHMIALTEAAWGHWVRALFVLIFPPLIVDGVFLVVCLYFFRFIPLGISHYVAYVGGFVLISFASHSLWELHGKTQEDLANSGAFSLSSVTLATLAEAAAPGTWIYWLTVAGPILGEGRTHGYVHILPFFVGGLVGYYGSEAISVWLLTWGAGLHKGFKQHLVLVANLLLLVMGFSYLIRAYSGK